MPQYCVFVLTNSICTDSVRKNFLLCPDLPFISSRRQSMKAVKLFWNLATTCAVFLATIAPAVQATAQAQPSAGAKTVLLIHGAWADGSSWAKVIPLLEAKGLHVVAVQIPLTSFADDVAQRNGPSPLKTDRYYSSGI